MKNKIIAETNQKPAISVYQRFLSGVMTLSLMVGAAAFSTGCSLPNIFSSTRSIQSLQEKPIVDEVRGENIAYQTWKETYVRNIDGHICVVSNELVPQLKDPLVANGMQAEAVVSEAMGYGLLLAVENDDKDLFFALMETIQYLAEKNFIATDNTMFQVPWAVSANKLIIKEGATEKTIAPLTPILIKDEKNSTKPLIDGRPSAVDSDTDILVGLIKGYGKWAITGSSLLKSKQMMELILHLTDEFVKQNVRVLDNVTMDNQVANNFFILKQGGFIGSNNDVNFDFYSSYPWQKGLKVIADFYGANNFKNGVKYYQMMFEKIAADSLTFQTYLAQKLKQQDSKFSGNIIDLPESITVNLSRDQNARWQLIPVVYTKNIDPRTIWRVYDKKMTSPLKEDVGTKRPAYFSNTLKALNNVLVEQKKAPAIDSSFSMEVFSLGWGGILKREMNSALSNLFNQYGPDRELSNRDVDAFSKSVFGENAAEGESNRDIANIRAEQLFSAKLSATSSLYEFIFEYVNFRIAKYGDIPESLYERLLNFAVCRLYSDGADQGAREILLYTTINAYADGKLRVAESALGSLVHNYGQNTSGDVYVKDLAKVYRDISDNTVESFDKQAFSSSQLQSLNNKSAKTIADYKILIKQLSKLENIPEQLRIAIFNKIILPECSDITSYMELYDFTKKALKSADSKGVVVFSRFAFANKQSPALLQEFIQKVDIYVSTLIEAYKDKPEVNYNYVPMLRDYALVLTSFQTLFEKDSVGLDPQKSKQYDNGVKKINTEAQKIQEFLISLNKQSKGDASVELIDNSFLKWQTLIASPVLKGQKNLKYNLYEYSKHVSQVATLLYWSRDAKNQQLAKEIIEQFKEYCQIRNLNWESMHSLWAIAERIRVDSLTNKTEAKKYLENLKNKQKEALSFYNYEAYANLRAAEFHIYSLMDANGFAQEKAQILKDNQIKKYLYIYNTLLKSKDVQAETVSKETKRKSD